MQPLHLTSPLLYVASLHFQAVPASCAACEHLKLGCDCALDAGAAHGTESPRCHDVLGTALTGDLQAQHIIRGCSSTPL